MPQARTLRLILADHLTRSIASLEGLDPAADIVLMAELRSEATTPRHHKQKLVLHFSAMRHFADELRAQGIRVDYIRLNDHANTRSLTGEVQRAMARHAVQRVIVTEPGEWRLLELFSHWRDDLGVPLEIRADTRFLCSRAQFTAWAADRRQYRMEFFYRDMRRRTGLLMSGDKPEGGQWNYDPDNRKRLPVKVRPPAPRRFVPDAITREVMSLVSREFPDHFGDIAQFGWAVTRRDALDALAHFIHFGLPSFGDYQDAMRQDDDFLFHAALSPYLNCGLLTPREVCDAAEHAFRSGNAPLNAVEGFIRQIIGWREYVRGIYWHLMPGYAETNALNAQRPLPAFYWTGQTDLNCLRDCIRSTRQNAYAHHIQRLMVTGNFALLAGVAPREIEEWYLIVYADAYEWVELPNVHGMVMHADGGQLGSKPYAASGAYINRMSNYCEGCRYDPALKAGPTACPFNALYWNFLIDNEPRLRANPRMAMPYRTLAGMSDERRQEIVSDARIFLDSLA